MKFVGDTASLEIFPRCSPSVFHVVVHKISEFSSTRKMELNPKKCKEMVTASCKVIDVSGVSVERVSSFKRLGLMLSYKL